MRKWLFMSVVATISILLAACGVATPSSTVASQSAQQNTTTQSEVASGLFSAFTTTDLAGNAVDQSVLQNAKITMVNVWATFCGPCLNEMPDLGALHQAYADKSVQVIGLVTDANDQSGKAVSSQITLAQNIVEKTGANYLHLQASSDLITQVLRDVSVVPTTFFVDAQGNLVADPYLGARSQEEWSKIIDSLLETMQ